MSDAAVAILLSVVRITAGVLIISACLYGGYLAVTSVTDSLTHRLNQLG